MNFFDLVILAVLVLLTIRGGMKGMVSQIVSVGSYFVGWIVASRFAFAVAPMIPAEEPWNRIGAMLLLFAGTMIAVRFLHKRIETSLEKLHLKEFNRQMGALLGLLKGVLICMVITFFAVMLTERSRQSVFESKSGKYIASLITKTGAFIPGDTCKLLKTQIALFDAEVNGSTPPPTETASGTSNFSRLAQGVALVDEAQKLRDDLKRESNNASSLLDAIGKWWNGDSSTTKPEAEEETKVEAEKLPETPVFAKQPLSLQPPPLAESAKLTSPSLSTDHLPVLPKTSSWASEEQAIRNLASLASVTPEAIPSTPSAPSAPSASSVPLSLPRDRFLRRMALERTPERLLTAVKEAPSPKAAALYSPQQRQPAANWDPKTWAQSLENVKVP